MAAHRLLGQILKDHGAVHEGMVQEALVQQREKGGRIGEILMELGHIGKGDLAKALAEQAGLTFVDLSAQQPQPEALAKVDLATARAFSALPVALAGKVLTVAIADPVNLSMLADLAFTTGCEVKGVIADESLIAQGLEKHYREDAGDAKLRMKQLVQELQQQGGKIDLEDKTAMAAAAPVVKLLNYILYQAIRDKASDIHLEPFEGDFKIRYRVDGALFELEAPPPHLAEALIARIKVMADLDIAETRLPQDGRIELTVGGRAVDLRVSTLPTMYGESTVMRVLDRSVVALDLDNLGLLPAAKTQLRKFLQLPHGIVLVTGPTGSGKTTTLYGMLNEANGEDVKIITVEDPVEYDLEGIIQIPVNEEIEVTYSKVLRTILRQDPDVILVGEIRDRETAQTAIEASLTGHLVFSTLHTNDAPSAITRLCDMGVKPFLVAAAVQAVLAQRLVRVLCPNCAVPAELDDVDLRSIGLERSHLGSGQKPMRAVGCAQCDHSGYRGRLGIFEMMQLDESLREKIFHGEPTVRLREHALQSGGMTTLLQDGAKKVLSGKTSVQELLRVTAAT